MKILRRSLSITVVSAGIESSSILEFAFLRHDGLSSISVVQDLRSISNSPIPFPRFRIPLLIVIIGRLQIVILNFVKDCCP